MVHEDSSPGCQKRSASITTHKSCDDRNVFSIRRPSWLRHLLRLLFFLVHRPKLIRFDASTGALVFAQRSLLWNPFQPSSSSSTQQKMLIHSHSKRHERWLLLCAVQTQSSLREQRAKQKRKFHCSQFQLSIRTERYDRRHFSRRRNSLNTSTYLFCSDNSFRLLWRRFCCGEICIKTTLRVLRIEKLLCGKTFARCVIKAF